MNNYKLSVGSDLLRAHGIFFYDKTQTFFPQIIRRREGHGSETAVAVLRSPAFAAVCAEDEDIIRHLVEYTNRAPLPGRRLRSKKKKERKKDDHVDIDPPTPFLHSILRLSILADSHWAIMHPGMCSQDQIARVRFVSSSKKVVQRIRCQVVPNCTENKNRAGVPS